MKKTVLCLLALTLVTALLAAGCTNNTVPTATAEATATTTTAAAETTTAADTDPTDTDPETSPEAELVTDARTAYQSMLNNTLVPQYGMAATQGLSLYTYLNAPNGDSAQAGLRDTSKQGIVGAWYADLDADGTEEMLVGLFAMAGEEPVNHMIVKIYTYVAGSVTELTNDANPISMNTLDGAHTEDLSLFLQKKDTETYLAFTRTCSYIDPISSCYQVYQLKDGSLTKVMDLDRESGWEDAIQVNGEYIFRNGDDPSVDTKNYGDPEAAVAGELSAFGIDLKTMANQTSLVTLKVNAIEGQVGSSNAEPVITVSGSIIQ